MTHFPKICLRNNVSQFQYQGVLLNTQILDSYTQTTQEMFLTDVICYIGGKRYIGTFDFYLPDGDKRKFYTNTICCKNSLNRMLASHVHCFLGHSRKLCLPRGVEVRALLLPWSYLPLKWAYLLTYNPNGHQDSEMYSLQGCKFLVLCSLQS